MENTNEQENLLVPSTPNSSPTKELKIEIPETVITPPAPPPAPPVSSSKTNKTFFSDNENEIKTLATTIKLLINVADFDEKYSINLSKNVQCIIENLLKEVNFFEEIENILKSIIRDNKIDAYDVPQIMLLMMHIYSKIKEQSLSFNEDDCGEFLKTLFLICIKEDIIPITENEKDLFDCFIKIVDTSIELMTSKEGSEKKGIFKCLTSCMKDV